MKEDELSFIKSMISKLEEFRKTLAKYEREKEENEEYKKDSKVRESIDKDIFVERGRLLQFYKNSQRKIDELEYTYDMYISIYNILTREENENYTKADKVNYLKNSIVKSDYLDYESDIIRMIKDNLDNVDLLKEKIIQYGKEHGFDKLIELRELYGEELKRHKENIKDRYNNEFVHRKTKLFSMFTMLPKAVGLAVDKVKTCIDEKKEAKENLAKQEGNKKIFKALGQVVATPFIFTGKWVIDHWYLLLLLLLGKKGKRPKRKKQQKEEEKEPDLTQEQEALAYSPAFEKELEKLKAAAEEGKEAVFPGIKMPEPATTIDYSRLDSLVKKEPQGHMPSFGAGDGPIDPNFVEKFKNRQALTAEKSVAVATAANNIVTPVVDSSLTEVSKEQISAINSTCKEFINSLEESGQYKFFVASNHPNTTIVHSAEEFIKATGANIRVEDAVRAYNSGIPMSAKASERTIIWPEVEEGLKFYNNEKELAEHILSGDEEPLTNFYNRYVEQNQEKINNALGNNIPLGSPIIMGEDGKYYVKGTDVQVIGMEDKYPALNESLVNPLNSLSLAMLTCGGTSPIILNGFGMAPVLVP